MPCTAESGTDGHLLSRKVLLGRRPSRLPARALRSERSFLPSLEPISPAFFHASPPPPCPWGYAHGLQPLPKSVSHLASICPAHFFTCQKAAALP